MTSVLAYIGQHYGDEIVEIPSTSPQAIEYKSDDLLQFMRFLHTDENLYFDMLSCITGVDNGPEQDTMEVIYNLYSIPFNHQLMVKVILPRSAPEIPSLSSIWKTADWLERETYDMYGIKFTDHPDLRRILLPADWEGFPLRKDYQQQVTYHGIEVAHEDALKKKDNE